MAKQNKSSNQVRIIGGQFRGRKVAFPDRVGLRPTGDRMRETLFNWLQHDTQGASCLDCFAGSGVLGIESISRGAGSAIFIENDRLASSAISTALEEINITTNTKVITSDFFQALENLNQSFDIIFCDPPFQDKLLSLAVTEILQNKLLNKGGLLYVEFPKSEKFECNLNLKRESTMGETRCQLWINEEPLV